MQALSAPLSNTFGEQKTLVILVNFQDKAEQSYTATTAQNVVFDTTSNFNLENSFGQTWLTGDVVGWFTIPLSYTVCDTTSLATYAKQAATAAGVNLSNYSRYLYAFPSNSCGWWGLGSVGGNPSQAWINGSFQLKVVAHEMGHNFGLYHSHGLDCGTTTLGSSCSAIEYGDRIEVMGNPYAGHFNAFQKERLGWLNYNVSPPLVTVQTGGVYTIDPYETAGMNPKALKILKSIDPTTGLKTWYYVESYQAIGFDSFLTDLVTLANSNVLNGVLVHTGSESSGDSGYLLDMTPGTDSFYDAALVVGQSFSDPDSGVTITPMSVSSTGATVAVSFGSLTCVSASPTVSMSPSTTQWLKPGASITYTVTVTENDNAGCATTTFALQSAAPSGWASTLGASSLSLNPGGSASTTLTVTAPATVTDGFYTVGMTATNSGNSTYTASTSVSVSVLSSLGATVTTDKSAYTRGQTVYSTVTVTSNGSPVAGASVTLTLKKANGSMVTATGTTGANGVASFSYKLNKRDPTGGYTNTATVVLNGVTGSGSTTFTVK